MADARGERGELRYTVIASSTPGVFNLGGDLALFKSAIQRRDRASLVHYGRSCVDTLFRWWQNCHLPITTISLVQGDALGGGFECALCSSVLIAEEDARMGFPEILFNLFPGMGAYSFLSRKVGRRITEELVTSGTIYTARQLYDLGVVDVITPTGTGEAAVESYVRKHARSGNGRRGIESIAREMNPLKHEELVRVVELWADAALKLSERDLRMMERIVRAQQRQAGDEPVTSSTPRPTSCRSQSAWATERQCERQKVFLRERRRGPALFFCPSPARLRRRRRPAAPCGAPRGRRRARAARGWRTRRAPRSTARP